MKALWRNRLYVIIENHDSTVELRPVDDETQRPIFVSYAADDLIIDPTDGDIEEAEVALAHRSHCCDCPHVDYLTVVVSISEHECESCGERFIDRSREKRYFGTAPEKR